MTEFASSPPLRAVVLDTGPLGLLSNPREAPENLACREWAANLGDSGVRIIVPEIADYELRRELLQARLTESLDTLGQLLDAVDYLPLNTAMMRRAAAFWAQIRQAGRPTADRHALDGDVILAAQTLALGLAPGEIVVATTNVSHLARFVTAKRWQDIH